jgi:plastocyanin
MKIVTAVLAAILLLAGCSGSSDEPAPEKTKPADTSKSFDRDELDKQAKEQAEQTQEAQDELAEKVDRARDAQGTVVKIVIEDGKVSPQGERVQVKAGQKITLAITTDVDEEVHVHSDPEHTYQVKAGRPTEKSFTIETPGQVAVEAHHLGVTIVQLVVRS